MTAASDSSSPAPVADVATPGPDSDDTAAALWNRLPDAVRMRLADLAAAAVGGLPPGDVPRGLRRLAQFTPAKRARLGVDALLTELRGSPQFRSAVVEWWREHRPEVLQPAADDVPSRAAVALLTGDVAAASDALTVAAHQAEVAQLRAERDAANARAEKLAAEVDRLRAELAAVRAQLREAEERRDTQYQQLRKRVGEQGAQLRAARDAQAAAERRVEEVRRSASAQLAAVRAERDQARELAEKERQRAERAASEVAAARQAAREARQADEVRLGLLVDTLSGAVEGLRRELALGGGGPRPADLVSNAWRPRTGGSIDTPAALDVLLTVRSLHLVVDGYNVTKTGYPELPLADQRDRLVGQLAALAARTGVEITVVFDGAGVVAAPTRGTRGVRVLFSDPGVLADDVIRSIVAVEPEGRPVLVVTSDREVAAAVRERGAHTAPSEVLLARLTRLG